MKKIIPFIIISLLLISIVIGTNLNTTNEINTHKFNLTEEEKKILNSNYGNNKIGDVIDYQKGTHHTYINFDSGYRIITENNNFNKMKNEK